MDYEDPVFQSFGGSPITSQMDGRYCMGVFRGEDLVNTNAIKVSVFLLNTRMRVIPFLWTFITMCACCLSPRIIIDI